MSITRRSFLKGASGTAVSGLVPISLSLSMNKAFANEQGDYKSMVCLFLHGGSDSFNMIIPTDASQYDKYTLARPDIGLTSEASISIPNSETAQSVAINAAMPNIAEMLNQGNAAALVNIGTLVEPTNKTNYPDVKKPTSLGAHNKQQFAWQSSWGEGGYHSYGWAGLMMDVLSSEQAIVSDSLSFAGNELLTGARSKDISVSSDGIRAMDAIAGSSSLNNNFIRLVEAPYGSDFKKEYNNRLKGILDFQEELQTKLDLYPEDTTIPSSSLGSQLRMVRRMMQASSDLGHSRQVFFVNLGGFDNHSNQRGRHDGLLATIDAAVSAFHASLVELGLEEKVVTFTMSDFGRTIENNSKKGTDHGWGSNQLVVGKAVNGGVSYGKMPDFVKDGQDAWGNKFIPSQSSEQLGATLCRWMGLSEEGVDVIFPTLHPSHTNAFDSRYLGVLGDYKDQGQEAELAIMSVSATETRVDHTPQMAIDGDPLTKWTAQGVGIQYVIELAQTATVSKLLYSQAKGDVRQYLFDLEVSNDGVNYELVENVLTPGTTTGLVEQAIGKSAINFIRLTCNGNNGSDNKLVLWNNFQELKVLGY
ncbi:DUF1501 domain-containing protein [Vibrio sp. ZSDE26]|uniref:DUF1501 domain-containing protein n=1 Tax=Vibrio amylolyticus TaxID=2847292 RepID=A0A9X1XM96_9VIBR|nr:DUF1501 domain-containing protein [Vibrio amylolyticus]MCK6265517.1 DUF1501 domain-containing protein [Vibrio amylolyticus]